MLFIFGHIYLPSHQDSDCPGECRFVAVDLVAVVALVVRLVVAVEWQQPQP